MRRLERPSRRDATRPTIGVMTADRRDWDLIVVGLGALGSGAAYWASTRPGRPRPRPRAVRVRPRQRRLGRPQPDHPALLPPARLRPARQARLRDLGRGRGRGRRADRDGHRRPRPVAGRPGDPEGRLHGQPGRRGRPVRAARRRRGHAPLAAVAPRRRRDRDVPGAGRARRPVSRATPRIAGWPRPAARRSSTGRR